MSRILTIATCQHKISSDLKSNFSVIGKQIRLAALKNADIVHFSECNLSGYADFDFADITSQNENILRNCLKELLNLAKKPVVFDIKGIKCGLLICHEWRYPELYREYKKLKTEIIFQSWYDGKLPLVEYNNGGREHGDLIIGTVRGNAANNHIWISACNTCNKESSFPSFVAQPDGNILHKLNRNRSGILISEIDMDEKFSDPSRHWRERLIKR